MSRRLILPMLILFASAPCFGAAATPAFKYYAPGLLAVGQGRTNDRTIYFPDIMFPLSAGSAQSGGEAFANSQVHPIVPPENAAGNYVYPWRDTYCEARQWPMALCPGKHGHQGVDIRPQSPKNKYWPALAMADGVITGQTRFTVLTIRSMDAHGNAFSCRYMHMDYDSMVATGLHVGDTVSRGQIVGKVSNIMGAQPDTTIHLHFDCFEIMNGNVVRPPVYASLIEAYRKAWGFGSLNANGQLSVDPVREVH
jgi:murein DD-endopeptidase MepM/ murein hydrolase activator NlpD